MRTTETQMNATDDKIIMTPAEAESLLQDGNSIHNFISTTTGMLIGCDYDRADAIEAFRKASVIELAGDNARSFKHPIAVWGARGVSFFEADMAKVATFEAARAALSPAQTEETR